ncbi:MAG: hypothetical protein RSD57_18025, partial [Comamonas sp.]
MGYRLSMLLFLMWWRFAGEHQAQKNLRSDAEVFVVRRWRRPAVHYTRLRYSPVRVSISILS